MAEIPAPARRPLRFSLFELDPQSGELRKAGVLVGLQEQSLKVLTELLERPGDLVTREQLRQKLWPNGTFVDFEHGLNAVINRLRETLGDSADSPRFIQTVPRRGYRFIARVEGAAETRGGEPVSLAVVNGTLAASQSKARSGRIGRATAIAIAGVILLVASVSLFRRTPPINRAPLRVVPLTRLAGKESWPAFAPDGDQVAFAWSGEKYDNTDIYVTLVGSTDVRRLTTDEADDFAPAWSPDGRRIAFLRRSGNSARIHVTSALGGPDAKLGDFPVGALEAEGLIGPQITWSPDGHSIVAGRDPRFETSVPAGLYLIPVDGGDPRPITRPRRPAVDFDPAFSAEGRRLAYLSCGSIGQFLPLLLPAHCGVRIVDVDDRSIPTSAARTLTTEPVEPSGLAWNRDGSSIVFVGGAPGPARLWRVGTDGNQRQEPIEIASPPAEYPAATRSRDRLAFSQFELDEHLYRFNEGLPPEQVAPSSSFEIDPALSADGQRMAFVSGRSGNVAIWVASSDGSHARQVTLGTRRWPGSPAWSPDGYVIAFDSSDLGGRTHIWTVDADGGTPRQLTTGADDQAVPTWSRDGKWIYFSNHAHGTRDIWRVRASGGTAPEQVTRTGSGFLAHEFADGTSVVYQPKNADSPLLLIPLTGAAVPRRLVDCVRSAAFAPAGRAIVYVACASGSSPPLHVIDPVSGKDRLLGRLEHFPPGAMHVNLAATPDGKSILFKGIVRSGGDLMLIENFR
jgi:Tol biopolymer transport system component/DNA-binding winged helix-turn-helix (wHTH) protein